MSALLAGEDKAWNELSALIERILKHASQRHYIPDEDINDLRQEILEKLIQNNYQNLKYFAFRCRLTTWIGSIVNNHIYDKYRTEIRREKRNLSYEQMRRDLSSGSNTDDELVVKISDSEKIEKALEHLSKSEKRIIRMAYWDGLKPNEIAKITGERQTTVTTRLTRARNKLKEILIPKEDGESLKVI